MMRLDIHAFPQVKAVRVELMRAGIELEGIAILFPREFAEPVE